MTRGRRSTIIKKGLGDEIRSLNRINMTSEEISNVLNERYSDVDISSRSVRRFLNDDPKQKKFVLDLEKDVTGSNYRTYNEALEELEDLENDLQHILKFVEDKTSMSAETYSEYKILKKNLKNRLKESRNHFRYITQYIDIKNKMVTDKVKEFIIMIQDKHLTNELRDFVNDWINEEYWAELDNEDYRQYVFECSKILRKIFKT